MTEHRVPMLGGAWRHRSDPLLSSDPRVRELVGTLAGLEVAPAPRPEFRAELRAQLVAVAPRLVAEGETAPGPPAQTRIAAAEKADKAGNDAERPRRRIRLLKPLVAAACVLTAFVLLLGGAVLISRNALPGDALYGVKRASENTEYSLTGGSVAKGKLKLEFAARRIGEVAALLPRASALAGGSGAIADGGAVNADTAQLIRDTLGSADGDVETAAQLLGAAAVRNSDPAPLAAISAWTPGQLAAMHDIVRRIPAGALHRRALGTLALLGAAQQRAALLRAELTCGCLSTANADALGPRPCTAACSTRPATHPRQPTAHRSRSATPISGPTSTGRPVAPATHPAPAVTSGSPAVTSAPPSSSTAPPPAQHTRPGTSPAPKPTGGPSSPTLPGLPTPTLSGPGTGSGHTQIPITVNSSCAGLAVGPIHIGVGGC